MIRELVIDSSFLVAGWCARWTYDMIKQRRAWRAHQKVDREESRILGALRRTWAATAPRGPAAVARSLYTTQMYEARHRAPLEDSEAYLVRTLKAGWRQPQIPVREVFRT